MKQFLFYKPVELVGYPAKQRKATVRTSQMVFILDRGCEPCSGNEGNEIRASGVRILALILNDVSAVR